MVESVETIYTLVMGTGSKHRQTQYTVADPGFPRGGGANLLFGHNCPENCMKMKEFGPRGGGASLAPPLDLPMVYFPQKGLFAINHEIAHWLQIDCAYITGGVNCNGDRNLTVTTLMSPHRQIVQ